MTKKESSFQLHAGLRFAARGHEEKNRKLTKVREDERKKEVSSTSVNDATRFGLFSFGARVAISPASVDPYS
jgi:hypothetical protein